MGSATVLYAGTNEGVVALQSDDGDRWETRSQGLKGWSVPKLDALASQPGRVVAGTRGDGVWVSDDFGETWDKPCYGKRGPGKVRCVTIDPRNPDTIYAGTEPIDLFISRDGAKSWDRVDSVWDVPFVATISYPAPPIEPHVREVLLDPKDPNTLYIALQVGYMLKSTDGGGSWRLLEQEGLDADVHTMVLDPANPERIFIATGGNSARQGRSLGRALYMSSDAGETWSPTAADFSQEYSVPLAMHPTNPAILYSAVASGHPGMWREPQGARSAIIRTTDGGETWQQLQDGLSGISKQFPAAIVFDQEEPDRIYIGLSSGELYASRDAGDSWRRLEVRLPSVSDLRCVRV